MTSTRLLLLALAPALGFAPASARAQVSEAAVKAAFIPKIARYVDWPARTVAPGAPLQICIVGNDPFGRLIDEAVTGQSQGDHAMLVRRGDSIDRCQIAFLGGNAAPRAMAILKGRPVLTVTDSRDGPTRGMIHFALKGGRVSFHIDDAQAAQSGITISARLLAIALSVRARNQ